jgi:hypothetical protein
MRKRTILWMIIFSMIIAASLSGCKDNVTDGDNMPNGDISIGDIHDGDLDDSYQPDVPKPDWKIQIITVISDEFGAVWNYLMSDAEPYIEDEVMMIPFGAFAEAFGYEKDGSQNLVIKNGSSFISLHDVAEKYGLNTDWWHSDFHEANFVWIADCALLEENDYQQDDNYELEREERYDHILHEYTLKADGRTYRNVMLHDTYDKVIEMYGLPTRIFYSSNESIIYAVNYDFRVFPDGNTDTYLYFSFEDGVVESMRIVIIEELVD